jgi:hypothetical protein
MLKSVPKYSLHKASGRAYVYLEGKRVYLGKHGSEESHRAYADEISKWQTKQTANVTIKQLTLLDLKRCEKYYGRKDQGASTIRTIGPLRRSVK